MDYGLWIDFVLVKIIKLLISVDCENMILFHAVSNLFKIILPCLSDIDFDNNSIFLPITAQHLAEELIGFSFFFDSNVFVTACALNYQYIIIPCR